MWPSLRKVSYSEGDIPLTIIAGTRKRGTRTSGTGNIRFVSGNVIIPPECGGIFSYEFDRIGLDDERDVCWEAMALYFETLSKAIDEKYARDSSRFNRYLVFHFNLKMYMNSIVL